MTTQLRRALSAADFFAATNNLVPDTFQRRAVGAIEAGRSVLVAAPTGSGKTLVASYAVARALSLGERAVYTAPIKALSNQKFQELVAHYGSARVGLITGDRSIRPQADVVVMTTEVLRAMLEHPEGSPRAPATIILDEFHYLHDPERGGVWEEVVMLAPPGSLLVCLSATLHDRERLADWLAAAHPPCELVAEAERPIPLAYHYAIGNVSDNPPPLVSMLVDGQPNPSAALADGARRDTRGGEGLRRRDRNRPVRPSRSALFRSLAEQSMDPVIWFLLSRTGCERAVAEFVASSGTLLDPETQLRARSFGEGIGAALSDDEATAAGFSEWLVALELGVAAHHSGLLPALREAVEVAFAEGLLRLVFATETLAVGVNLPARTVVIDRIMRGSRQQAAMLGADAFTQLAGRAGRRGLDTVGHVVVPWSEDASFAQVVGLIGGRPQPLVSHFRISPALVANLSARPAGRPPAEAFGRSLAAHLDRIRSGELRAEVERLEGEVTAAASAAEAPPPPPAHPVEADGAGRNPPVEAGLSALSVGDLICDPGRRSRGVGAVVGHGRRRGAPFVWVVTADGRQTPWDAGTLRQAPAVVGHVDLAGVALGARGASRQVAQLVEAARSTLAPLPAEQSPVPDARADSRQARRAWERLQGLRQELARLRVDLDHCEHRLTDEYKAMVGFLERLDVLVASKPGPTGEMLRRLYHPAGLLVAEALRDGLADDLDGPGLAAFASFFVPTGSRNQAASLPPGLVTLWREVSRRGVALNDDEDRWGLARTPPPDSGMAGPVWRWAGGRHLTEALGTAEVMPGDLVREVRQVIELLEQVRLARPILAATVAAAIQGLDRGAVASGAPTDDITL